jgi:hypothetical protein
MKTENLTLLLNWLKENQAHKQEGLISIPVKFRELIIEVVGSNEIFKEELERNKISTSLLYNRILINREFAFNVAEEFWAEQFQLVQNQKIYFNNIKGRSIDPTESTDIQINEKIEAYKRLEYLDELTFHIESKMKYSSLWMNHLTYLLG